MKKTLEEKAADSAVAFLREGYDRCDDALKAKIDAARERMTAGRKKFPPNKLRSKRVVLSFNVDEYSRLTAALGADAEFASGVRELALKSADAILARRERRAPGKDRSKERSAQ